MRTLRSRLIISHLLPVLVLVPLAGLALIYILETQVVLANISEELTQQATLIAEMADTRPGLWQDSSVAAAYIEDISAGLQIHVMLIDGEGYLLAASDPNYSARQGESLDLPGLDDALGGKPMSGVHRRDNMADALVPVTNDTDEVVGLVRVNNELAAVSNRFAQLRLAIIGILLLELVLGGGLGILLALTLERPLRNVTTAIQGVSSGDMRAIPEAGPAEIRQLSRAFNELTARLQLLEETRRRLLANLVHELGRPLGALRSAVHALRGGADQDAELRRELLTGMETEINHLQPLLDDLSELHSQVLGPLELDRRETPLYEWLPTLVPPCREKALTKGLQWQAGIPALLPTVSIDPGRIAQAIGNLISNAIKYTPVGGRVMIAAGNEGESVWIRVSDTGSGVPPEEQERIFEPFYRGQHMQRFPQGLGLGLTIARDMVQAHGGRLELNSRPGRGSHFTIYLPV